MAELSRETQGEVAQAIFESGLLKFGTFTLKSNLVSPFYLDFRKAQSHPLAFNAIVKAYSEMIADNDESSAFIAGVPEAATPIAGAVAFHTERPALQPRKVVKDHGTKSSVEGDFEAGDHVILLDDLITKGDSKIEAIKQVEDAGLVIEKFIVLVDREQGGLELVRSAGYDIQAGFSITSLITILKNQGKISEEAYNTIIDFIRNN